MDFTTRTKEVASIAKIPPHQFLVQAKRSKQMVNKNLTEKHKAAK
jgi:hypothetical protein